MPSTQSESVDCQRCGEPSGISSAVLRANRGTYVICAKCLHRSDAEAAEASRQAWERNNGPVYEPITREHDA